MTGSPDILKVAIVGCGKIADGHVEQIRATGMAEPVAVCDSERLMARQLAMRCSVPRWYSDVGLMLEVEKPNVVHIATPPDSHMPLAKACLQAGCHIFMEKPFALDARQTRDILAFAAASGRRVAVNYLYNFETPYLHLMDQVRAGVLGEVVHLETIYGYSLAGDYGIAVLADPEHWVHRLPGKLFHNLLDHVLAKAAPFFDSDIMSAQTQTLRRRPAGANATLDSMADELRFLLRVGDLTVSGLISAHIRPVQHSMRVYGTKGSLVLDIGARTCVPVVAQTFPSAAGRLLPAWIQSRYYRRNAWQNLRRFSRHEFHFFQGMRVLLRGFYAAIQGQGTEPLPAPIIQGTAVAIDTVLASIHTNAAGVRS
ncbi:MAG: oxidoreductase [Gammaproteobacteria bacterium]|jgi:predicted dehydrogenase|nr:oxidoreductase [Gammaproteobacteria bacterium]